jgi:hypothetical protein
LANRNGPVGNGDVTFREGRRDGFGRLEHYRLALDCVELPKFNPGRSGEWPNPR